MLQSIFSLAVCILTLGAQDSETGTWASMQTEISGSPFTAAFRDVGTGFREVHDQRSQSFAEYQLTFYHHYPDESLICFKYGRASSPFGSEIGPVKYQDVKYVNFTAGLSGQLYVDVIHSSDKTTCGSGASMVGGTMMVPLLTSFSNTIGWGVGETGQGTLEANRATDADGFETIAQKHVNIMLWNAAVGFNSCTVSLSLEGVLVMEFSGVRMGAGKEGTLGCIELPSSPVTVAWTCDGSSYTKDLRLDRASCSGSSLQISLIGKKSDFFHPPVVVLHSGTDSCPEACGAVPYPAARSYGVVLYHHVPEANHFICFKYGFSAFEWITAGPFKYKDVHNLSVSHPHTTFYLDVIAAQNNSFCGSGSVSLVNGFIRSSLVDSAQNTYGYSPQSSGCVGVDANRAVKDGGIDIVGAGEVNLVFWNGAKGFNDSCSVSTVVKGNNSDTRGSIKLGSGKELTQVCGELPDKMTTIIYICDGEEFKWESGSSGLQAAVCAGSSQQFSLVGEKGNMLAPAPEVLLLSGAAAGCQSCASWMAMNPKKKVRVVAMSTSLVPLHWLLLLCSFCALPDMIEAREF